MSSDRSRVRAYSNRDSSFERRATVLLAGRVQTYRSPLFPLSLLLLPLASLVVGLELSVLKHHLLVAVVAAAGVGLRATAMQASVSDGTCEGEAGQGAGPSKPSDACAYAKDSEDGPCWASPASNGGPGASSCVLALLGDASYGGEEPVRALNDGPMDAAYEGGLDDGVRLPPLLQLLLLDLAGQSSRSLRALLSWKPHRVTETAARRRSSRSFFCSICRLRCRLWMSPVTSERENPRLGTLCRMGCGLVHLQAMGNRWVQRTRLHRL